MALPPMPPELKNGKIDILVKDFARAWASLDGKLTEFDAGEFSQSIEDHGGHYAGYTEDARELMKRAVQFAIDREDSK